MPHRINDNPLPEDNNDTGTPAIKRLFQPLIQQGESNRTVPMPTLRGLSDVDIELGNVVREVYTLLNTSLFSQYYKNGELTTLIQGYILNMEIFIDSGIVPCPNDWIEDKLKSMLRVESGLYFLANEEKLDLEQHLRDQEANFYKQEILSGDEEEEGLEPLEDHPF